MHKRWSGRRRCDRTRSGSALVVSRTDALDDFPRQYGMTEDGLAMNPWIAKALVLAATVVMIAIRAPHGRRSRSVRVAKSHQTPLETGLLVLAGIAIFVQ